MKSWLHCLQLIKRYHSSMIPVAVLSALFHALEIPVLLYALHLASRSIFTREFTTGAFPAHFLYQYRNHSSPSRSSLPSINPALLYTAFPIRPL